ncbi:transglutaminase-like domain-containing protein [Mesorhizobium sp. J428]|uniref:transglutaminase-like domain-containing protein n=1 Tax=Mesorhizobium sp. J428 TaxID=2898440 RepID=UPI002151BA78|nr:transglutaminase-like domain-containing protein [Mesorhizobium sp. J428]MCR5858986.1 transglutaminase-like domain-containing protein [Mesorhizobium sp. J428]
MKGIRAQPKVGGVCRDFAILAFSTFRERGIPARLRVGFADHLVPGRWEDHWLCEWYDGERWKRLDVEFAAVHGISFDTLDVPRERFLTASEAWFRIQGMPEIASQFGVSSLDLGGEWFVAGSLFREIAALRGLELKPWNYWGLSEEPFLRFGRMVARGVGPTRPARLRLKGADVDRDGEPEAVADWPLPEQVISFPYSEPVAVVLRCS